MQASRINFFTELERWYTSDNGRYLLDATRSAIQPQLDTSFGYHLLQLGLLTDEPLGQGSPIHHRIHCGVSGAQERADFVNVVSECDEIPVASDSIDTVIAHHCLEFSAQPHRVLREIQRVLTPQGQLLLIGFNPYSLHGVGARVRGLFGHRLWAQQQPISSHRLQDWLHLLGCEVRESISLYSAPPIGSGRIRQWLTACDQWLSDYNSPLGGLYILHARKQVAALHPPLRVPSGRRGRLIGLVTKPVAAPNPAPSPVVPLAGRESTKRTP